MRGLSRLDAVVGVGFVLASIIESVVRFHTHPGLLAFDAAGSLWLITLAVRRRWPLVTMVAITGAGLVGSLVGELVWPDVASGEGVWLIALMLAAYSLGAHTRGRAVLCLGVLLPLLVALSSDVLSRSGWELVNGVVFVTVFIGVVPMGMGRLVRVRGDSLQVLRDQQERIVRGRRAQLETAVLAERLRTTERLQPTLLEGMQGLADSAQALGDPGVIESAARELLTRTRREVVELTAPVEASPTPRAPVTDQVGAIRAAAQPWVVIAAAALVVGLAVESTRVLALRTPDWVAVLASLAVGLPLALAWWRPVAAVSLAWVAAAAYSRAITPLDGTLSETGFALAAAFAVSALSRRRAAIVGLAVCLIGQVLGVGTDDPLGEAEILLVCWLGGLAVHEVSRLVEQTRANNLLLAEQARAAEQRAVVEERLRLARDLHDAIGHSLTVVGLQAGAARRLMRNDPERSQEVMRTVAEVAREGLLALRLGGSASDLAGLVERTRATGLVIDADIADEARLDPAQAALAHRVVREALTNVLRHAPGSRAAVVVRRCGDRCEVTVTNTAPDRAGLGPGTGRGLVGLRERLDSRAGRVVWGPSGDGGFEVRAELPATQLAEVTS